MKRTENDEIREVRYVHAAGRPSPVSNESRNISGSKQKGRGIMMRNNDTYASPVASRQCSRHLQKSVEQWKEIKREEKITNSALLSPLACTIVYGMLANGIVATTELLRRYTIKGLYIVALIHFPAWSRLELNKSAVGQANFVLYLTFSIRFEEVLQTRIWILPVQYPLNDPEGYSNDGRRGGFLSHSSRW